MAASLSRALRASRPVSSLLSRQAPVLAVRSLRAAAPVQSSVPTVTTDNGTVVPVDKFVDSDSLAYHMAKVRHSDPANRTFNYTMIGGARFMGASAARLLVVKFFAAMNPAADVLALASLEVDIGNLQPGNCMIVKWRGKPVFIRSRTEDEIAAATSVPMGELRDPQADEDRVQKAETLVCIGVCTHLGCVPINGAGDYNGWFCPCHGSHYDTSGRIRKGPAPLNLEIPPYSFVDDTKLLVG
ncbi:ubiquinol--cytochrome-c reductase-like protein [Chrysochromulina tobinii]|uniref:Cytochrome b-c1 complex subunit Rieske, mitochondrial n=1 Tax=Chrysochromulina tobinii TaxID=1460289 RepID=A0A0M0JCV5_9EUKA|nr:ubiquinol--cytochrome-c reductase-like protein [Chrysochromulina tobinii]|eukprot:KOO24315.1 ubiquinol--cytochrome-c reductase-like protein [Chrysochromulina sp. CCMP291]